MKKAIVIAAIALGASALALLGVIAYASTGRALGQSWTSLDGPGPVWPAIVGFGSMWLIAISGVALMLLLLTAWILGAIRRAKRSDSTTPPVLSEQ